MTRSPFRPATLFVLAATVVTLGSGCVSRVAAPASGGTPTHTAASTTTSAATTATSTTTTTTAATTTTSRAAAPENAADGTDYAACFDGTCEVFVNGTVVIPLDPRFGFTTFEVTRTPGTTAVVGGDPVNGNLRAAIGGTGELNANGITMKVVDADAAGAILSFQPRAG